MDGLYEIARHRGLARVEWTTDTSNEGAEAFYEALQHESRSRPRSSTRRCLAARRRQAQRRFRPPGLRPRRLLDAAWPALRRDRMADLAERPSVMASRSARCGFWSSLR